MDLLIYLPANVKGPAPLFLNMSFAANNLSVNYPNVKVGTRWDPKSRTQVPAVPPYAVAGEPVYELLGKKGLGTTTFPAVGAPILPDLGYLMHEGDTARFPPISIFTSGSLKWI